MSSPEGLPVTSVSFEIIKDVEVSPDLLDAAQKAATLVWDRNCGEPTTITMKFGSRILDEEGQRVESLGGQYSSKTDIIEFGMDDMAEHLALLDDTEKIEVISAHETMHRIQLFRDDTALHEFGAWMESVRVLKILYPEKYYRVSDLELYFKCAV